MSPLTYIFGWPILMALVLMAVPRENRAVFRWGAILATLGSLVLALFVFAKFEPSTDLTSINHGYAFVQTAEWIPALGISFHVGVDGVSVLLVLMAAIVAFAAACCASGIKAREKEFAILLLLMTGGILGAFMALDIFLMYFLHELALIPTFIMIGIWGSAERQIAALEMTIYHTLGALISLLGIVALYLAAGDGASLSMIDLGIHLADHPIAENSQKTIFGLLLFGLGVLVSLFPTYSWAPRGYGAAPTSNAMLHAGVLKNGFERVQVLIRHVGPGEVGLGDNLQKWHARAIEIHATVIGKMRTLAHVLLEMRAVDAYPFRAPTKFKLHKPLNRGREIQLRELIILRVVRIKIIFPVPLRIRRHSAIQQHPCQRGLPQRLRVRHRQHPRQPKAHRAHIRVCLRAIFIQAPTPHLRTRTKLHVRFQAYHCFVFHQSNSGRLLCQSVVCS